MEPWERALDQTRSAAREQRGNAIERWRSAIGPVSDSDRWPAALATAGRLTVNFHPDRVAASGHTVAAGLAATGTYESQWVTGISNGGRSAFRGGDRHSWERTLFGGAYDDADPAAVAHPIYGALDLLLDPHGGSPRFGSSYLVLAGRVRERTTICVGDSHAGPTDVGTFDESWGILAGLADQAARHVLLHRRLGIDDLVAALAGTRPPDRPSRDLDGYVEAQIHGGLDLAADVDTIVLDPSFRDTAVERDITAAATTCGIDVGWHAGSELDVADIPDDFRGPAMPALGRRVARPDGIVDAHAIGVAARSIVHAPMQPGGDPPDSDAQQLKRLWHVVLAVGRDASSSPASYNAGMSTFPGLEDG